MHWGRRVFGLVMLAGLVGAAADGLHADEGWNPFRERDAATKPRRPQASAEERPLLAPMQGGITRPEPPRGNPEPWQPPAPGPASRSPYGDLPPPDERSRSVERGELAPATPDEHSAPSSEPWPGLDLAQIERHMAALTLPPRSPAVHALWRRLLMQDPGPASSRQFDAVRLDALYRSGLLPEMREVLEQSGRETDPIMVAMRARFEIAAGDREQGCRLQRQVASRKADLPRPLRAEVLVLGGYCAATTSPEAAGLAAELAREEGAQASYLLQILDGLALGATPQPPLPKQIGLLDYRFAALAGGIDAAKAIERADAALLAALSADRTAGIELRVVAGEAAARVNIIEPEQLAALYRAVTLPSGDVLGSLPALSEPLLKRALLFRATEAERTPLKRARFARALLDDARRNGLYLVTLRMLAKPVSALVIAPEIGWFAETVVEVMLASGQYDEARRAATIAASFDGGRGETLTHWIALTDIADPTLKGRRGEGLVSVEQLALRGRFNAELLHRLATVLDSLDYDVPLALWQTASSTPQPTGGHLPETGVLSELHDASRKKEVGRTVLLAMQALGPNGAEGAHMIALGDTVRALKRAGLEPDARRVAFEALFASWPRSATH